MLYLQNEANLKVPLKEYQHFEILKFKYICLVGKEALRQLEENF